MKWHPVISLPDAGKSGHRPFAPGFNPRRYLPTCQLQPVWAAGMALAGSWRRPRWGAGHDRLVWCAAGFVRRTVARAGCGGGW